MDKEVQAKQKKLKELNEMDPTPEVVEDIPMVKSALSKLLARGETWWAQRSRGTWLTHEDKNTSFFFFIRRPPKGEMQLGR